MSTILPLPYMATKKRHPVGWFELPVTDMERAMKFYETVLKTKFERHTVDDLDMAWFPMQEDLPGASGSLVLQEEWYVPSGKAGVLLYFSAQSGDLKNELDRVEDAGGTVLQEKKPIGEHGFVAFFLDTEGNRVALHSMQ